MDKLLDFKFSFEKLNLLIHSNFSKCDLCLGEIMCKSIVWEKRIFKHAAIYLRFPAKVPEVKHENLKR